MSEMKVCAVIGDLVGSRDADDRQRLHAELAGALAASNRDREPVTPWRITVGDEFQGAFASVGAGIDAALGVRLSLGDADVRFGLGWGTFTVLSEEPRVEDGEAWWAARAGIEGVAARQLRELRRLRTAYVGPSADLVNAALLGRDELLGQLDSRSLRLLAGRLEGRNQSEVAATLGISPSAASQRVARDGLTAIQRITELLATVEV
jgi:hypothetical protein